jgi:hypothetical protein
MELVTEADGVQTRLARVGPSCTRNCEASCRGGAASYQHSH